MSTEEFDSFYRSTRDDLVLQTLLLTGDLTAAAGAVRDAYAITWQHWRKVTSRGEPIDHTRPLAWRLATRRHTGRIWHRNKGLSDSDREVLDALHQLGAGERRAVLLIDVAKVAPELAGHELAVTRQVAQQRLETGRAALAEKLGPSWLTRLRGLRTPARAAKLPRTQTVQRAGRDRGRLIVIGSVVGAVALTVLVGVTGREPHLDRDIAEHRVTPHGAAASETPEEAALTDPAKLLDAADLQALTPRQAWTSDRTDPDARGDGINMICQTARFADPHGLAALVRTFDATGKPARTAVQTVEVSRNEKAAQRAYDHTVRWFAECTEPRLMLTGTYAVGKVGDEAEILQIAIAGTPSRAYDVGIARTGQVTTTTLLQTTNGPTIRPSRFARVLGQATARLCVAGAACTARPVVTATAPPRSGEEAGFVATVDLPPVGKIEKPWVGVPSVNALGNVDKTTRCDRANFMRSGAVKARARTWLIPEASLPDTFGFTETYGRFRSSRAAEKFLAGVRASVKGCEDRDLTATVGEAYQHDGRLQQESSWRFENKVSDKQTVPIRVGFVRSGNLVSRLVFFPAADADMTPTAFQDLVARAGARLRELT
ncbi:MAG: hypothetical protein QM655_10495 [Nocardioidaceae bacterium]